MLGNRQTRTLNESANIKNVFKQYENSILIDHDVGNLQMLLREEDFKVLFLPSNEVINLLLRKYNLTIDEYIEYYHDWEFLSSEYWINNLLDEEEFILMDKKFRIKTNMDSTMENVNYMRNRSNTVQKITVTDLSNGVKIDSIKQLIVYSEGEELTILVMNGILCSKNKLNNRLNLPNKN